MKTPSPFMQELRALRAQLFSRLNNKSGQVAGPSTTLPTRVIRTAMEG